MDLLRIFLMSERSSEELQSKTSQLKQYKEAVLEKDVLVRNHLARINELEIEVAELKLKQSKIEYTMTPPEVEDNDLTQVIISYDNVVQKLLDERQNLTNEKTELENHIVNLESNFQKLLNQYEKSKLMIDEIMEKEKLYEKQVEDYKQIICEMKRKHKSLVKFSQSKIVELKLERVAKEKENVQFSIGDRTKINDMDKCMDDLCRKESIFEYWKTNISEP